MINLEDFLKEKLLWLSLADTCTSNDMKEKWLFAILKFIIFSLFTFQTIPFGNSNA